VSTLRATKSPLPTIAIIGGGAGGSLAAIHLLDRSERECRVVIVEPRERLGAGVAYSTAHPMHLLNTPAGEMSLFSNRPDDVVEWGRSRNLSLAHSDFLPRSLYGDYVAARLEQAQRSAEGRARLEWVREEVTALAGSRDEKLVLGLSGGGHLVVDAVVLAVGAPEPAPPPEIASSAIGRSQQFINDPWAAGALDSVPEDGDVLLLGSGLTMVDVAATLSEGRHGVIHARSRHGVLPLVHVGGQTSPPVVLDSPPSETALGLTRWVRASCAAATAAGTDWREIVREVRNQTASLWPALPIHEQRRFLRHAYRYWDIHRHRMAAPAGALMNELQAAGRLTVAAGNVSRVHPEQGDIGVKLVAGRRPAEQLRVAAIVNCTGPSGDVSRGTPLLRHLLERGVIRPHPIGIGIAVIAPGNPVAADGSVNARIHTIGFLRRGSLLESTAIPELRHQAEDIALRISRGGGDGRDLAGTLAVAS
jgi:uncharacterized NAD(P)/FAD-binding protein YdhS